jgi:hypothetical protein
LLRLNLDAITYGLNKDNYFDVFDFTNATVSGTFSSISPEIPKEGMIWDLSKLYTEGRIYVREEGYTAISQVSISDTNVYPTMTSNRLNIELPSSVPNAIVCIYDITGKQNEMINIDKNTSLDVSSYPKGLYFMKLTDSDGEMIIKKFIKQ